MPPDGLTAFCALTDTPIYADEVTDNIKTYYLSGGGASVRIKNGGAWSDRYVYTPYGVQEQIAGDPATNATSGNPLTHNLAPSCRLLRRHALHLLQMTKWEHQRHTKIFETPSVGQENMWKGQVEAFRKRAEMAEQLLEERTNAMSRLIAPANLVRSNTLWHIVLRFMPFAT